MRKFILPLRWGDSMHAPSDWLRRMSASDCARRCVGPASSSFSSSSSSSSSLISPDFEPSNRATMGTLPPGAKATVFFINAAVAYYFLWVVSDKNGLFAQFEGTCAPGGGARSYYSGIKSIDGLLCVLVSFFTEALSHPPQQRLLGIFCSLYYVNLFIFQATANQPNQHAILRYCAPVASMLCQLLGSGFIIPLWCGIHSLVGTKVTALDRIPSNTGEYIIASLITGIIPGFIMLNHETFLSTSAKEALMAAWQPFPIWTAVLASFTSHVTPLSNEVSLLKVFRIVILASYYIPLISYIAMIFTVYGGNVLEAIKATFMVPMFDGTLAQRAHTFLYFDFISTLTSSCYFVMMNTEGGATNEKVKSWLVDSVLYGPGIATLDRWIEDTKSSKQE